MHNVLQFKYPMLVYIFKHFDNFTIKYFVTKIHLKAFAGYLNILETIARTIGGGG